MLGTMNQQQHLSFAMAGVHGYYNDYAMEDGFFPPAPFAPHHGFFAPSDMEFIDPSLEGLQHCASLQAPWDASTVQRYLNEPQKTTYFSADGQAVIRPSDMAVHPMPSSATNRRFGSPMSSSEPSSTSCSSALSPPSDSLGDMPTSATCDFQVGLQFAPPQAAVLHITGMSQDTRCCNLADINPVNDAALQQQDVCDEFVLRSVNSFDSCVTDADARTMSIKAPDSPDSIHLETKHEIVVQPKQYVSSTVSVKVENDTSSGDEDKPPPPPPARARGQKRRSGGGDNDDDDDDGDYKPHSSTGINNKKPKHSRRQPKSLKRHAAAVSISAPPLAKPTQTAAAQAATPSSQQQQQKQFQARLLTPPTAAGKGSRACKHCPAHFSSEAMLEVHVKKQHLRPFTCVFAFAGCDSTFASKNEWKRHVQSQHLNLQYWLCTEGSCVDVVNSPALARTSSVGRRGRKPGQRGHGGAQNAAAAVLSRPGALPNGAIFNRKDLYTQHVRRMHQPAHIKQQAAKAALEQQPTPRQQQQQQQQQRKNSGSSASSSSSASMTAAIVNYSSVEWDGLLRKMQERAHHQRCQLPTEIRCPAHGCSTEFRGPDAWDGRMEHVARHLERAAEGKEPKVVFGGPSDPTLMAWARRPEVAIIRRARRASGWQLHHPLKPEEAGLLQLDFDDDDDDEDEVETTVVVRGDGSDDEEDEGGDECGDEIVVGAGYDDADADGDVVDDD